MKDEREEYLRHMDERARATVRRDMLAILAMMGAAIVCAAIVYWAMR